MDSVVNNMPKVHNSVYRKASNMSIKPIWTKEAA